MHYLPHCGSLPSACVDLELDPGRALPAETRASIQAECEEALSRGMWSRRVELSIASHHGCQPAVVRRQRAVVERLWAMAAGKRDIKAERATWLERIRKVAALALAKGDFKTAERCLRTEARVLGLEQPIQVDVTVGRADPLLSLPDVDLDAEIQRRQAELDAATRRLEAIDVEATPAEE
jgi:hypothetical protein